MSVSPTTAGPAASPPARCTLRALPARAAAASSSPPRSPERCSPGRPSGTASAASGSPVVGHTYVNGNNAGENTVVAFDRHADGSLTPTPGSPFAIGGRGAGGGLGSQGALQSSPDGRYLLAVDAGSDEMSVLRLGDDGVPALGRESRPLRRRPPRQPVGVAARDRLRRERRRRRQQLRRLPPHPAGHPAADPAQHLPRTDRLGRRGRAVQQHRGPARRDPRRHEPARQLHRRRQRPAHPGRGLAVRRPRTSDRSARSSGPPTPISCSSATPTPGRATAASPRSRSGPTRRSPRSPARPPATARPRRAGSRSATTGSTCSPSTPASGNLSRYSIADRRRADAAGHARRCATAPAPSTPGCRPTAAPCR